MNLSEKAHKLAEERADRWLTSREPMSRDLLVGMLAQAFASGTLYGIERSQYAIAISKTAAERGHPERLPGIERAATAVANTHANALKQADEEKL